jgi:AcrR family transcriptional regulator
MTDEPARRGRKPSPEKREAIVAAALAAFAGKGVDATTTREIAEAAETTERTLFKHFGSKDGLVQAVVELAAIELMRERKFARISNPSPFTRTEFAEWHRAFLTDRVDNGIAAPSNYPVIFRELLRDAAFRRRFGAKWIAEVYAPLAAHLERMQATGQIASRQAPAALAGAFYSLNIGYLVTRFALVPELPWDDAANIEAIVEMFQATCGAG